MFISKALKRWIFGLFFFVVLALPVAFSFYKYYYTKDYNYLIEVECDPALDNCFYRDCTNPDDCPPGGLSVYKKYYIKAYDFTKCSDNSCGEKCSGGTIKCEPIECGISAEDTCTVFPDSQQ
ncbi:MAG: hypothetical protein PHS95_00380 [Candidatus Pacebacteria bacterium]|nr:hypothetical protein [Candidatus Paceibacterota bacterium]